MYLFIKDIRKISIKSRCLIYHNSNKLFVYDSKSCMKSFYLEGDIQELYEFNNNIIIHHSDKSNSRIELLRVDKLINLLTIKGPIRGLMFLSKSVFVYYHQKHIKFFDLNSMAEFKYPTDSLDGLIKFSDRQVFVQSKNYGYILAISGEINNPLNNEVNNNEVSDAISLDKLGFAYIETSSDFGDRIALYRHNNNDKNNDPKIKYSSRYNQLLWSLHANKSTIACFDKTTYQEEIYIWDTLLDQEFKIKFNNQKLKYIILLSDSTIVFYYHHSSTKVFVYNFIENKISEFDTCCEVIRNIKRLTDEKVIVYCHSSLGEFLIIYNITTSSGQIIPLKEQDFNIKVISDDKFVLSLDNSSLIYTISNYSLVTCPGRIIKI